MMATGVGVAFAPFAVATPAGAASNHVDAQASLTFVTTSGATVTCTVLNSTTHNTDNPNQPYTATGSGESGCASECFDFVLLSTTITYKDKSGALQTASYDAFATGSSKVTGTYSAITTSVTADYFDCDASRSATCLSTAIAHPK